MKTDLELINDIIENFEWQKVHKVMQNLNWPWLRDDKPPTIEDLIVRAISLLQGCLDESRNSQVTTYINIGGFRAEATTNNGMRYLRLMFVLTDWNSYDEGN